MTPRPLVTGEIDPAPFGKDGAPRRITSAAFKPSLRWLAAAAFRLQAGAGKGSGLAPAV